MRPGIGYLPAIVLGPVLVTITTLSLLAGAPAYADASIVYTASVYCKSSSHTAVIIVKELDNRILFSKKLKCSARGTGFELKWLDIDVKNKRKFLVNVHLRGHRERLRYRYEIAWKYGGEKYVMCSGQRSVTQKDVDIRCRTPAGN